MSIIAIGIKMFFFVEFIYCFIYVVFKYFDIFWFSDNFLDLLR